MKFQYFYMRLTLLFSLLTLLLFTCRQDNGESLFEMTYPALEFSIQAGQNPFVVDVVQVSNIPTHFPDFVMASGRDPLDINRILPRFARLVSLDGLEFGFLSSVSVRICPNTQQDCDLSNEVFYRDDLFRRRLSTIDLDPGLSNVDDLLKDNLYKLEVVFTYAEITPFTVDCRLDYGFEAFK